MEVKHGETMELPAPRIVTGQFRYAAVIELGCEEEPTTEWIQENFVEGIDAKLTELQAQWSWITDTSIGTPAEVTS
jgi:hypothetical protein